MKLSPSTIAANLSAAAAAEAEAAAATNSNLPNTTNVSSHVNTNVVSTATGATALSSITTIAGSGSLGGGGGSSTSTSIAIMNMNPPGKTGPRDTQFIADILKEMGIHEYEPRVLSQLVEFAYRYASQVLEDAQLFSSYAKKKQIDANDVNIALQMQSERSFTGPPSRDVLLEIARHKNAQPLPPIKSHNGMRLPADRYSLVASNLRLAQKQQVTSQQNNNKSAIAPRNGTSLLSKFSVTTSTSKIPPSTDSLGVKRRIDET